MIFGPIIDTELRKLLAEKIRLSNDDLSRLVHQARNSDSAAMEALWRALLLFTAKHIIKSKYVGKSNLIDPDEAMSIAYETLYNVVNTWDGRSSFPHWYRKKLLMDIYTEARRRARNEAREVSLDEYFTLEDDPDDDSLDG